jgi:hypothetical protein
MARVARSTEGNECRRCSTFCDRVIDPATCVAAECAFLYHYDDPLSGRRYLGCVQKVFEAEIDVELFAAAERTRTGFGTVRITGAPLRRCAFEVDRAYAGTDAEGSGCVNRRFFDAPDTGPDALRAFDLRDGPAPA